MKKTTTNLVRTLCLASVLLIMPYSMSAQVVINGSFEQGTDPGDSMAVLTGNSTTITGWTVQSGSVDYIGTRWVAADGNRSLDLSGQSAGSILQNAVSGFTVGMQYRLSFFMAANTEGGPAIKSLRADIGSVSQSFSFDGTGHSASNMGWSLRTLDFVATGTSMNLDFTSLTDGVQGPTLDAVSIQAVPEPQIGTILILGGIIGSFAARRAGRETSANFAH